MCYNEGGDYMDEVINLFEQYFVKHWFDNVMRSDRWIFRFENNYGASIVKGPYSYGGKEGKYELGLIKFYSENPYDWKLYYDEYDAEPETYNKYCYCDVAGYLNISDIINYLNDIKGRK